MSQSAIICPKCNGEMVQGYVIDRSQGNTLVSSWAKGTPNKFWLGGIKMPNVREQISIGTFRCESCGFLESYAREEFKAK